MFIGQRHIWKQGLKGTMLCQAIKEQDTAFVNIDRTQDPML